MIQTKVTKALTLSAVVPAGKLNYLYRSLLPLLVLCSGGLAWSQTVPRGARVPPEVFTRISSGVQQASSADDTPANAQYRFVSIDIPGSTGTFPYGITNTGLVTGGYFDANNNSHGLAWQDGKLLTLDHPGSVDTGLSGSANSRGVVMGYFGDLTTVHAGMYSFPSGAWTTLPDIPGMPNNEGYGVNNSGVEVGVAGGGNDFGFPYPASSWIWDPRARSYFFFAVPGSTQSSTYAEAINDRGQVVGWFADTNGVQHGFLKEGERYTAFDVPGAEVIYPFNINNSGTIVGQLINLAGGVDGFVRTSDGTVTIVDFPGASATVVGGINDRGDICGYWFDPNAGALTGFVGFKK
jgi:probable HAF family extracellular repeat protein